MSQLTFDAARGGFESASMPPMPKPDFNDAETLATLREAQRTLEIRKRHLENQLTTVKGILDQLDHLIGDMVEPQRTGRKPGPTSVIKPIIINILKAANGAPVHADTIMEGVRAEGIALSEKDPKATIVTALLRMHRNRMAHGETEGVEKLGGNRFRWIAAAEGPASSNEPQQPPALFPAGLLALASQRERARP